MSDFHTVKLTNKGQWVNVNTQTGIPSENKVSIQNQSKFRLSYIVSTTEPSSSEEGKYVDDKEEVFGSSEGSLWIKGFGNVCIENLDPEPYFKTYPISDYDLLQMSITYPDPAITFSVTGTGDIELNPADNNYIQLLNVYEETLHIGDKFTVNNDGSVTINQRGLVKIDAYLDLSHSENNTTVGAVFAIERNGVVSYSARAVHNKMPNSGDISNISGNGSFIAEAGDIVSIAVASNLSGTIRPHTSTLVFEYMGNYPNT